jgi:hypothetical protein
MQKKKRHFGVHELWNFAVLGLLALDLAVGFRIEWN